MHRVPGYQRQSASSCLPAFQGINGTHGALLLRRENRTTLHLKIIFHRHHYSCSKPCHFPTHAATASKYA
jgi:hypothetical protein